MALKIEFSTSIKDAEQVIKVIHELNQENQHLSDHLKSVGENGSRAFTELGRSLEHLDKISKTTSSIKEVSNSIQSLVSKQNDIVAFTRNITDAGRAINEGLGMATDQAAKKFKTGISEMQNELKKLGSDAMAAKELLKNFPNASSEEKSYLHNELMTSAVKSDLIQRTMGGAIAENMYHSPMFGKISPAKMMGTIVGAAGTAQSASFLAHSMMSTAYSGQRASNLEFNLANRIAVESAHGDPTLAILQGLQEGKLAKSKTAGTFENIATNTIAAGSTVGTLAGYAALIGSGLLVGGAAIAGGMAAGPVGAIAAGGAMAKSTALAGIAGAGLLAMTGGKMYSEVYQEQMAQSLQMDKETYEKFIAPGFKIKHRMFEQHQNLYRQYGEDVFADLKFNMANTGQTSDMLMPVMEQTARHGVSFSAYRARVNARMGGAGIGGRNAAGAEGDIGTQFGLYMDMSRRLNLSQTAQDEVFRAIGAGDIAPDIYGAMGASGLTNRYAMGAYGDIITGMTSNQVVPNFGVAGAIGASILGAGNQSLSETERVRQAGVAIGTAQSRLSSPQTAEYYVMGKSLLDAGLTNPVHRALVQQAYTQDPAKARKILEEIIGSEKANEAINQMQGSLGNVSKMRQDILVGGLPESVSAETRSYLINAGMTGTPRNDQTMVDRAIQSIVNPPPATGGAGYAGTPLLGADQITKSQSDLEADYLKSLEKFNGELQKIGSGVYTAIAAGFKETARLLQEKQQESMQDRKDNQKKKEFEGTKARVQSQGIPVF